nr:uncharacterized protein LOC126547207 [Dermacentor andersoni]
MERAVLNRMKACLEDNEIYPRNIIGFRQGLATQDAMELVKRIGQCLHDYIPDFLRERQASQRVGSQQLEPFVLSDRGTPQGAVISPTLFNLTMIGMSRQLTRIESFQHTIYADDVTMWVAKGSEGQIEHTFQNAIRTTEEYLKPAGLQCSSSKSELPLYRPNRREPKPKGWDTGADPCIRLYTVEGNTMPGVGRIKMLGMTIEANGSNTIAVAKLTTMAENATRLLRRVANRHHGLKEDNLLRLAQAFVISHFVYIAAMHNWSKVERDKLDTFLRNVAKRAMGLPMHTSTQALDASGIFNTLSEIAEAQEWAQITSLSGTSAGRWILRETAWRLGRPSVTATG